TVEPDELVTELETARHVRAVSAPVVVAIRVDTREVAVAQPGERELPADERALVGECDRAAGRDAAEQQPRGLRPDRERRVVVRRGRRRNQREYYTSRQRMSRNGHEPNVTKETVCVNL